MTIRRSTRGPLGAALLMAAVAVVALGAGPRVALAADSPWFRPPTFEATGGPGWIMVTEATPGDPVHSARWVAENGRLSAVAGPIATVGAGGGVLLTGLEPGFWIVATESTVHWVVTVAEPTAADRVLTLMSFNIRYDDPADVPNWDARLPPILDMVGDTRPDVMGIQEGLHHQVLDLAAGLEDYDWIGVGRDDGVTAGEFAAIFYRTDRFEPADSGTFWLSETPDVPSIGWDAVAPRIVTWAELRATDGNGRVVVANTHFDHVGATARAESASLIATRIPQIADGRPFVVMGDLNVLPTDSVLDPLLAIMAEGRRSAPVTDDIGSFNFFLAPGGLWSLDYIFAAGATPLSFETIDDDYGVSFISDHFPVVVKASADLTG